MEKEQRRIDIISFMGPVNDNTVGRLIDIAYTADSEGSSQIHLFISSINGKLHPSFVAYDFFRALKLPFYTHNVGTIETTSLLLYLASDNRAAVKHSKFLFYNFEWTFYRDHIRFPEIIEAYESMKFDVNRYSTIFNERTNRTFDIAGCLTGPAQVMDCHGALAAGIVTNPHTDSPQIPELAKLWSIN